MKIYTVEDQEKEWDLSMFIQGISSPKPRVNTLTPYMEVIGLCKSDEDDVYNLLVEVSDDDFWGEDEEEDFWGEEDQTTV